MSPVVRMIKGSRFGIHDRLIFFPTEEEIVALVAEVSAFSVFRIRQTDIDLELPCAIWSGTFRTSCIDLTDDDTLLKGMSRSSRQQLRRVEKFGDRVAVKFGGAELADDFRRLYRAFVRAKGHTHPLGHRRLTEYLEVSDVWMISLDNVPFCGRLILRDDDVGRVRNLYESNRRFDDPAIAKLNSSLNRYLDWHAMRHYRDSGIAVFDWGGIGPQQAASSAKSYKVSMGGVAREDRSYTLGRGIGKRAFQAFVHFR